MDQHAVEPQSWNLYVHARNNPLKYVDPTGQAIQLMGATEEERQKELAAIQSSLGDSKVKGNLSINAEKDKNGQETGRYFVGIQGSAWEFGKAGDQESWLSAQIGSGTITQFGIGETTTVQDGPRWMPGFLAHQKTDLSECWGGEATHGPGVTPSGFITVNIDPTDIRDRQAARESIPATTPGEMTAHGLAHARGYMMGLYGAPNDRMAVDSENAARAPGGAARGQKQRHNDAVRR